MQVAVDPAALTGPQQEQVQPERADAQLSAQPLEALVVLEVHAGERNAALHAADYGRPSRGLLGAAAWSGAPVMLQRAARS